MTAPTRLPDRPSISRPAGPREAGWTRQPWLGLAGLALVLPIAALLAVGAGGAETSLRVLGPLATFTLPVVAMIGFWWEDWPGTCLRPSWSGWADTVLIIVAAVGLAVLGQAMVTGGNPLTVFDGDAFPVTMPLAAAGFVAMLQLTLVTEGWPLRQHMSRIPAGLCALAVSWLAAVLVYVAVLGGRPFTGSPATGGVLTGGELGAVLTVIGAWQVWIFVVWRGFPVAGLTRRLPRLLAGNALVAAGTWVTYVVAIGAGTETVTAVAGSFIAAGLLVGMQFEGALADRVSSVVERAATLVLTVVGTAALYLLLTAVANALPWERTEPVDWVTHTALNALALSTVLHVAIGRRWPFTTPATPTR